MATDILVIGSNSFSGSSFVRFLLDQGLQVVGVSRSPQPVGALNPAGWSSKLANYRFEQLDLNHDIDALEALLDQTRPPVIVNFAAQSMVAQSWQYPGDWYRTNVLALVGLVERLRHKDYLDRYIHVSTPEVYGSLAGSVAEDHPFNPSTPYAVSRAAGDMHLNACHKAYGFPVLFTRAANVYGPGQQLYRIIPKTVLSLKTGIPLPLHGGGWSERSFIHMDDVSEATMDVVRNGRLGQVYHIATNELTTIRALVERICTKLNVAFEDAVEITDDRLGKDAAYKLSSDKIRAELGWRDRISLDDGVDEVIDWVNSNLEVLQSLPWEYQHKP